MFKVTAKIVGRNKASILFQFGKTQEYHLNGIDVETLNAVIKETKTALANMYTIHDIIVNQATSSNYYDSIKENICHVMHAIQELGGNAHDDNLRLYIDTQLTIMHRKANGLSIAELESVANQYLTNLYE